MNQKLPYQVFYNFLNDDEINQLINYFKTLDEGDIIYNNNWNTLDEIITPIKYSSSSNRQVRITGIHKNKFPALSNKIKNMFDSVIGEDCVLEYPHFLTEYQKNSIHKPHTDYKHNEWYRDKVVTIQLSNSSDYEGGDLKIGEHILPRDKGCALIYNGKDVHEVTKVINGVRFSLTECAGVKPKQTIF